MATLPTFAFYPQGYKTGVIYSQLPYSSVSNFTFARNSEASYIDQNDTFQTALANVPRFDFSEGSCPNLLMEPSRTNLFLHSNSFSNSEWLKVSLTPTLGIADPFNGTNGWSFNETVNNSFHYFAQNIQATDGSMYVLTFYVKMMSRRYLQVVPSSSGVIDIGAWFDLQEGAVSSVIDGSANIEAVGDNWYKCSLIGLGLSTASVGINMFLSPAPNNSSRVYQGDSSMGVMMYNMQIEIGSYSTTQIFSGNSVATRLSESAIGAGDSSTFNDLEGTLLFEGRTFSNTEIGSISISNGTTSNRIELIFSFVNRRIAVRASGGATQLHIENIDKTTTHKYAVRYSNGTLTMFVDGVNMGSLTNISVSGLNELKLSESDNSNPFIGRCKQIRYYDVALTDSEIANL